MMRPVLAAMVAAGLCGCPAGATRADGQLQPGAMTTVTRKSPIRFNRDGRLTIVQFTDMHTPKRLDPRIEADMGRFLDTQKPDLVVLTGDNSTDETSTPDDLRRSVAELSHPMEFRHIPWVAVFGNHDMDTSNRIGITKAQMLAMYRSHPYNLNPTDPRDVYGSGNGLLQVLSSRGNRPVLGLWLIDSNANAPAMIAGQKLGGDDWIHVSQIAWYYETSRRVQRRLGHKLPSLMFLHICLPEFTEMVATRALVGDRKDRESPSKINSGMFAALLDRGDVLGVYVGHDHYNSYEGNYYGIRLGYGGAMKFASPRKNPAEEVPLNATRGARVFSIDENDPTHYETRYVHVSELR